MKLLQLLIACGLFLSCVPEQASADSKAFIHRATAVGARTYIDNGHVNGDANALLFVTPNWNPPGHAGVYFRGEVGVEYDHADGKWTLVSLSPDSPFPSQTAFNVQAVKAGTTGAWVHYAKVENIVGNSTFLEHPSLDGKPDAQVFVTQNLSQANPTGTINAHRVGVWYDTGRGKWAIFNQNRAPIKVGSAFNVSVGDGSVLKATTNNTTGNYTALDVAQANGNHNAIVIATPNWNPNAEGGVYNDHPTGVYYFSNKWAVFNQDRSQLPVGSAFNIRVLAPSPPPTLPTLRPMVPVIVPPVVTAVPAVPAVPATPAVPLMPVIIPTLPVAPPKARFRVVLTGFTVNRETWDDLLERDGKRDEVFILSRARTYGNNGDMLTDGGERRSNVMGDVSRDDWASGPGARSVAGSASALGGLRTGDSYPSRTPWVRSREPRDERLPMLLWEGELTANTNSLFLTPTIWEWDGDPDFLNSVHNFLGAPVNILGEAFGNGFVNVNPVNNQPTDAPAFFREVMAEVRGEGELGRSVTLSANILGDPKDRPIGMTNYAFVPVGIKLNYESAVRASSTDFGRGNGVIWIRYRDSENLKGDYTIYLQIERMP